MHTNNSTQRTPTPWRLSEQYSLTVEYKIGDYVATMCGLRDKAEANAAFIVRACNAHDELVAALEGTIDCLTVHELDCARDGLKNAERAARDALSAVRAAIAKAKGEQ